MSIISKAYATSVDLSNVTMPISSLVEWFLVIAAGLAIVWGIRKIIKITNRS